jgi:hypothetical protein
MAINKINEKFFLFLFDNKIETKKNEIRNEKLQKKSQI